MLPHLCFKQEQGLGDSHKMVEAPNFFLSRIHRIHGIRFGVEFSGCSSFNIPSDSENSAFFCLFCHF
jgi:hypothetical protein